MESLSCAWRLTIRTFVDGRPAHSPATPGIVKLLLPPRQSRGAPVVTRMAAWRGQDRNMARLVRAARLSRSPLSIPTRAELPLPGEGMGHDRGEVVGLRLPPQQFPGAVTLCYDPCGIPPPSLGALDTKIHA
jgi:hypothetical protein